MNAKPMLTMKLFTVTTEVTMFSKLQSSLVHNLKEINLTANLAKKYLIVHKTHILLVMEQEEVKPTATKVEAIS